MYKIKEGISNIIPGIKYKNHKKNDYHSFLVKLFRFNFSKFTSV